MINYTQLSESRKCKSLFPDTDSWTKDSKGICKLAGRE